MMDRQDDCRAFQDELAFYGYERPLPPQLEEHLTRCTACRSFAESVREISHLARLDRTEPPSSLVRRAMVQLEPELSERAREGFWLRTRLAIAGLVSLPVIVGLNGLLIWIIYSSLESWLSRPLATVAAYVAAASALLGLSLIYGSLPLLAEWGFELRRRCHDWAASAAVPHGLEAIGRLK